MFGSKWSNNQYQVIIGNEVNDVYEAICEAGDLKRQEGIEENLDRDLQMEKRGLKDLLGTFMETLSSISPRSFRRSSPAVAFRAFCIPFRRWD